jgi:hypothetical protein
MNNIHRNEIVLMELCLTKWAASFSGNERIVGVKVLSAERRSDKQYDVKFECTSSLCRMSGWLPLFAIRELTNWCDPKIANMSDYPEMRGDWSGIRDSEKETIWKIFEAHVLNAAIPSL